MSLSEHFQGLDPKIAEALQRAVDGLRAEFRSLLEGSRGTTELAEVVSAPGEAAEAAETAEAPPEAAAAIAPDVLEELKHAVARVDRAATQGEVLDSLLAGARRFSSRAALFVLRSSAYEGWGASGFESAASSVDALELEPPHGSPWARLFDGHGGVPLERGDCALLCDAIGAEPPEVGILLPLVLGDRVAAALYSDRLPDDGSLEVSALQLLTYNAGQVLETLPVRNREATATLRIAGVEPADEPTDLEPEAAPPAELAEEAAGVEADAEIAPDSWAPDEPIEAELPAPTEVEVAEPEEAIAEEFEDEGDELATRAMTPPPTPARESSPAETTTFEPLTTPPGTELEEWPAPANLLDSGQELSTTLEPSEIDEIPGAPPLEIEPEVEAEPDLEPEPEPQPPPRAEPRPEPEEVAAGAAGPGRATAEVRPPSDLEGPGWAFTQRRARTDLGEEALHEEARRLARLLVTEIKLYNEEQVDMGRQHRDLYGRLREDIERSRQIYADRIDQAVREKKDYFHEALVRILAGGDTGALGA